MQQLIHTHFPVLQNVHTQELLLNYAHDLVYSTASWSGCNDVVLAYLRARNAHSPWTQIAEVYACMWQSDHVCSLICALAICHRKVTFCFPRKIISKYF